MYESYLSVPLALIPLPGVRHCRFGTFISSCPMSYTFIDLSFIGAAIWPSVGTLTHGLVARKFPLFDKKP